MTKIKQLYLKEQKRIHRIVLQAKRQGIIINEAELYKVPKRVTYKQFKKLYEMRKSDILAKGTKNGEAFIPEKQSPVRYVPTREEIEPPKPQAPEEQIPEEREPEENGGFVPDVVWATIERVQDILMNSSNTQAANYLLAKLNHEIINSKKGYKAFSDYIMSNNGKADMLIEAAQRMQYADNYEEAVTQGTDEILEVLSMGNVDPKERSHVSDLIRNDMWGIHSGVFKTHKQG